MMIWVFGAQAVIGMVGMGVAMRRQFLVTIDFEPSKGADAYVTEKNVLDSLLPYFGKGVKAKVSVDEVCE